jgi:hypothetical protein
MHSFHPWVVIRCRLVVGAATIWWGAALAELAACDLTGPAPSAEVAEHKQALVEADPCTPADIAWSGQPSEAAQLCSGSWEYQRYRLCAVADPACGPKQCDLYNECQRWEFGATKRRETERSTIFISPGGGGRRLGANRAGTGAVDVPACGTPDGAGQDCVALDRDSAERLAEIKCTSRRDAQRTEIEQGNTLTRVLRARHEVTYVDGNSDFEFECEVAIEYEIANARRDPLCACSHTPYDPTCELRHPDCGTETLYTALGLPPSAVPAESTIPGLTAPICITCEHHPLDATAAPDVFAAQVATKFECLANRLQHGTLPAGALGEANRRALVEQVTILYELHGDLLGASERAFARELFLQHPEWPPACGAQPEGLPSCGAGPEPALDAATRRCMRLLASSHVPDAVLHLDVDGCMDLLTSAAEMTDATCRAPYLDAVESMATAMLDRSFDLICRAGTGSDTECAGAGDGLAHLPAALGFVDRWYRNAVAAFPDDPDRVRWDLSATLAALWRDVYQAARPFPDAVGDDEAEATLTALFEQGLWADRQVLAAAFSDARPLTSAPLLYLTADALRPLADRLEALGPMLDLACRYKGCDPATERTEVADAWAVLASLHDAARLTEALAEASRLRSEYVSVFARIRDHHEALGLAFASATGRPAADLGQLSTSDDPGEAARPLQQLVLLAGLRTDHVTRTGRFAPGAMDALHTGVQREKRLLVRSELAARTDALDQALMRYESERAALANDLLAQLRSEGEQTAIRHRLAHAAMRLEQMSAELDGLREREAWEEVDLAQFVETFDALMDGGAVDPDALVERDVQTLGVSAQTGTRAPRDDAGWLDIRDVAVLDGGAPWQREVRAGERVSFLVSGTWAPTCALRTTALAAPVGGTIPISIIEAQTGPEGYWVEWSHGEFLAHAQQTSTESFESSVDTDQSCFGATGAFTPIRLGGEFIPVLAGTLSASAQSCHETQVGTRQSSGSATSHGQETRGSASFSAGLRMPGTPVARAPAGALLAVALARGEHGADRVVDVRVVHRSSAFHYDRDVDLYLVVNDHAGCESDPSALTVEIVHATPAGVHAETLAAAMQAALADLRQRTDELATRGSPTPGELGALRAQAYAHLATAHGEDLARYPSVLRGYFDAWIERALASLERRALMHEIERAMALTAIELRSAADDLAQAGERARLVQLLPTWRLRNLSAHAIERELGELLDLTERHLYPVLYLRYPSALDALRTSHTAALDALLAADFTAPVDETAARVRDLARALERVLATAEIGARAESPVYVAVAFPRPGAAEQGGITPAPEASRWRTVDPARSAQVWDQLHIAGTVAFAVTPQDLYAASGGFGQLLCFETVPVIESMALFAVFEDLAQANELNASHLRAPASIDPWLTFPDGRGPHTYRMANGDWLPLAPRLLFGRDDQALAVFHTWAAEGRVGNGLSPLSTFTMDLSALTHDLQADISALVLVFKLDTRLSADALTWLETCQPSGGAP